MKIHPHKFFLIIFFFLASVTSLFAQQFEGELIYDVRDSAGKITPLKMYGRGDHARMSGVIAETQVDFYVTLDSLAMVFPNKNAGFMFGKDSAIAFFESEAREKDKGTDSLLRTSPTSKSRTISGFHCTCIEGMYHSGKKREFWVTSDVDSDLCMMFFRSSWLNFWVPSDGTAAFIRDLNRTGRLIIYSLTIENTIVINESTLMKVAKRPIADDEIEVPSTVNLMRVNPQFLIDASNKKK